MIPSLLVHFTDGSTATLDDGASALRGRSLDQIHRIELHPTDGGVVQGKRHDGVDVIGVQYHLAALPFPVLALVPTETAKAIAGQLLQVASGVIVATEIPKGRM